VVEVSIESKVAELEDVLLRNGFARCDIAACNCGSWHHRYGLPERWQEVKDILSEFGQPLSNENGHLVSRALRAALEEASRLPAPPEHCETYGTISGEYRICLQCKETFHITSSERPCVKAHRILTAARSETP
jgi:hypothetical protein